MPDNRPDKPGAGPQNRYFRGQGEPQPGLRLPLINSQKMTEPSGYLASQELATAVDVALTLGMPLLLTGEPGSGKSRLAHRIAWELGLGEPLEFTVKSDTQGRDLFYTYDALGRFHATQIYRNQPVRVELDAGDSGGDGGSRSADPVDVDRFIHFSALGESILNARSADFVYGELGLSKERFRHQGPKRSVVLIDEIDKAARDVPNDLLAEIDQMVFHVPELEIQRCRTLPIGLERDAETGAQLNAPIVIITSNSEKALPEAFLRRCVYYHLPFPEFDSEASVNGQARVSVERIVQQRLGDRYQDRQQGLVGEALDLFRYLRKEAPGIARVPSLAELLNWLDYLLSQYPGHSGGLREIDNAQLALGVKTVLLKNIDDQKRADAFIDGWRTRSH